MEFKLQQKNAPNFQLFIIDDEKKIAQIPDIQPSEIEYFGKCVNNDQTLVSINQYSRFLFVYLLKIKANDSDSFEMCRKVGSDLQAILNNKKAEDFAITNLTTHSYPAYCIGEGLALANYQFLKYRSDARKIACTLKTIYFSKTSITLKELKQLSITIDAIYKARTLVNEPVNFLSAEKLSEIIASMGKEAGFGVTILNKAKIVKEKMGGLLAVNMGSKLPPTFTIMEYKPKRILNKKPIVFVGKGIVFDTGGLSLKTTLASMDRMKSDMSGAALISCAIYAIAKMELPVWVVGLVPATDNRPGENAYTPGDVITMYSGKTVEVLNTDAEGRLVLADALHYAKRYEPELVVDFATLTGAASQALGENGIACMGTADANTKKLFKECANRQYERLVEFPLWDEYGEQIKSDIADIKNVGGPTGGIMTAGKFLEHFIEYPWMHFDIAGVSLATAKRNYITSGGTGYGLRMLVDFVKHYNK